MTTQLSNIRSLDRADCLRLLRSVPFGRLVYTNAAMPAVQPVNFIVRGNAVIIRTASDSKLSAAARHSVVAFQTDDIDVHTRSGWTVTLIGHSQVLMDRHEIAELAKTGPDSWARPDSDRFIFIEIEEISGGWLHSPADTVH